MFINKSAGATRTTCLNIKIKVALQRDIYTQRPWFCILQQIYPYTACMQLNSYTPMVSLKEKKTVTCIILRGHIRYLVHVLCLLFVWLPSGGTKGRHVNTR